MSDTATVTVTVNGVSDAPIANPDDVVVDEDTAVTIPILDNDSDPDGDLLTMVSLATPDNGVAILNVDNSVTYTPTANFTGGDSFTYTISNTTNLTDTAAVSITVTAVNDLPIAVDDTGTTEVGVAITLTVLSNDSDIDGDSLTVISNTQPISGTAVLHGDNTISYTPMSAGTDSFSYTVDDGYGGQAMATVTIDVSPPNRDPIGVDDNGMLNEDTTITVNVLVNDSDPDGDPLTIAGITTPTNGTAVLNLDYTISYTPTTDFNGADAVVYTLADGEGGFATATMSVTVLPVNDMPFISGASTATTDEDVPVTIPVLDNVTDVDNDPLTVISVTQPISGLVAINLDNTVTYTPTANFNGNDNFDYVVDDGNGAVVTGTLNVSVISLNDAPEIVGAGLANTDEDTAVTIPVLDEVIDADGDLLTVISVTQPISGVVVVNLDNSITYTPTANFNGSDSFNYTISDENGGEVSGTISVTVTSVNDAPEVVGAGLASTDEDTAVTISVLDNVIDADGDPLTVISVTQPISGAVAINLDNTVTYTPTANFNGNDSFDYTIDDGNGGQVVGTINVSVGSLNDAPIIVGSGLAVTDEDTAVTIAVLDNVVDPDGDPMNVISVTQPISGAVNINLDNSVTYTPTANFNGSDNFGYTVSDGNGGEVMGTISVTVTSVNDVPEIVGSGLVTTDEDTAVTIPVLDNLIDEDGDPLTVISVTQPISGVVLINNDNTVTYTPTANFNGNDNFNYIVNDGNGGEVTGTINVTVNSINDSPEIIVIGVVNTNEDTPIVITILDDVIDIDGDPLLVTTATQPLNGVTAINLDDTVTYTPTLNFHGNDSFDYTVSDNHGGQVSGTISVTVESVNDLPQFVGAGLATTDEDVPLTISVLDNVFDPDGDTLTVTMITQPLSGTAVLNLDNSVTYTPTLNFQGTDSFTYIVSDGNGGIVEGTISVTVNNVNDAPEVIGIATAATNEDTPVTIPLLDYVVDPDGDLLTVLAVSSPLSGTAVINLDNSVTYTPTLNIQGTDSFTYTVADGNGGQVEGQVVITIGDVNDLPVAVDDSQTTPEDTTVTLNILANDTDVDGDLLTVQTVTQPTNGQVVINPDDTVGYTPNGNFNGSDSFDYTISDGHGGTDSATVVVTVAPVNDAPVATDDRATIAEDNNVTITALSNDADVDGDTLSVDSVTQPANGSATVHPDNTISYAPDADFNGADNFTYTIKDGQGGTDTAVISVTVMAVNDAPLAIGDVETTNEDLVVHVVVLANDNDVDGDTLSVTAVTSPTFGTAAIEIDNSVTYTPTANFNGGDAFSYTISDSNGGVDTAVISITVSAVNDAPLAVDDNGTTNEDTAVTLSVLDNDVDVDGDSLVVSTTTQPTNGVVFINIDNSITYTPTSNFNGSDSFTYVVIDSNGGSDTATVSITVSPVNDLPDVVADTAVTDEDTAVIVAVLTNDSDVDGDSLTVTEVTTPTNGTVIINPDETVSYTPFANFNGNDSFNYTVADEQGGMSATTVSITVMAINDQPIAVDDAIVTPEDTAVTIDVLANDSDVDGDTLTVTAVSIPTNGIVTINIDGSLTYTPTLGYNGSDSFNYTVDDGQGGSASATVAITVTGINDNPVAVDDHMITAEDNSLMIDVLSNDSDNDGDSLTVISVTPALSGTAVISGNNVIYTPNIDYFGTDSFNYTIDDGQGGSATATVFITVTAVNDAPIAIDDTATTNEDTAVDIVVLANDSDVDGDSLQITNVGQPDFGNVSINPDHSLTYTPTVNVSGSDTGLFSSKEFHHN